MQAPDIVLLTAEEEVALGRRVQAWRAGGDEADGIAARNELVERNRQLVGWVIDKKMPAGRPEHRGDDEQAGFLGLLRAAERYDPGLGLRFSGYAVFWVRQQIQVDRTHRPFIRVPRDFHRRDSKLTEVQRQIKAAVPRRSGGTDLALEFVAAPEAAERPIVPPEVAVGRLIAAANLDERERLILIDIFGLGGAPKLTMGQCGRQFGISKKRIHQIRNAVLGKIRKRAGNPDKYLDAI